MTGARGLKKDIFLGIVDIAEKVLALLFYAYFVQARGAFLLSTYRISSLLIVILETLAIFLLLFRTRAKDISFDPYDWAISFAGFLLPTLFRPTLSGQDSIFYSALQFVGLFITITGILTLNKSFGLVPANRGLKMNDIYRLVRHPLYLGYLVCAAAYTIQNISYFNIAIFSGFALLQILRIISEERLLSNDALYQEYKKKTSWRMIPFIW